MAISVYLRSPVAVGWTLLGGLAIGTLSAVGWLAASAVRARVVDATPLFLGGLGQLLYLLGFAAFLALLAVVWLPFGAGVAYAVGRRTRGDPAGFRESASAVLDGGRPLARWLKTRAAVGGLADRLLTDEDVAPNEVAVGCGKFVVPAVVLDASGTLPRAVERANRVTPRPGHERLLFGSLGATGLLAGAAFLGGFVAPAPFAAAAAPAAAGLVVVGVVVTAALDAAWRAEVYASQDLTEGFSR